MRRYLADPTALFRKHLNRIINKMDICDLATFLDLTGRLSMWSLEGHLEQVCLLGHKHGLLSGFLHLQVLIHFSQDCSETHRFCF